MTKREQWVRLTEELATNILSNTALPSPMEQLDNLILWFGTKQRSPTDEVPITEEVTSAIGATDSNGVGFIASYAKEHALIGGVIEKLRSRRYMFSDLRLTLDGWQRYYELQRSNPRSSTAFMAMKFGDTETDALFRDYFKGAVKNTGFDLRRLDEEPRAGLIDDRLRVEIRQSRFLIADLSHGNPGAYWEAGYAEGLGKPVIYTCKKSVFDDEKKRPHFDTNHHLTVVWDPDNLGEAVEILKATIRATLPEDAKLSD